MESKVPKATHLSNWKRHKDKREAELPPARKWRDERTHNKFPRATRRLRLAKEERCGSVGGRGEGTGLGSSTSRPQHLYHKSPQSSDGSFQSLGVSAMEKSHGLSASAGLSYFTRDSTSLSLSPSHSKLMLAFEDNIFKISLSLFSCWEAIFEYVAAPICNRLRNQSSSVLQYWMWQGSFFCQQQFRKSLFLAGFITADMGC